MARERRFLSLALLAAAASFPLLRTDAARTADLPDWENEQVVGINKLEPHAPVYPFADAAQRATLDRESSPYYRLLNGRWKFRFSPNPESRPLTFFETGFDDAAWDTIPVPSNIEKNGYAPPRVRQHRLRLGLERPPRTVQGSDYVGRLYPSLDAAGGTSTPPRIPHELNYVGSYRHRFEVPGRVAGPARADHLPGRLGGLLPVGEREEGRLQRGQPRPGRVRHHGRS